MWNDAVITDQGRTLLAGWIAGTTLSIDRAAVGTGTVSTALLPEQTALTQEKASISIISTEEVASGVKAKLQLASAGITTSFILNQIGIWASLDGGTSKLITIIQDGDGVRVPTESEMPDFVFTFYAIIQASNEGTLTVNIDTSAFVTQAQELLDINEFRSKVTTFNNDGTIDEVDTEGNTRHIEFTSATVITETFKNSANVLLATKTTTFSGNVITETVV